MPQTRARITDTSFWNGLVNHQTMVSRGIFATIIRCGSANKISLEPYTDYRFHETAKSAVQNLSSTCYFYIRLGGRIVEQVDYAISLWEQYPFNYELVLDVEDQFYPNGSVIKPAVMRTNLKTAVDRVKAKTGHYPILYSRTSFFDTYVGYAPWMKLCKFWVARYVFTKPLDNVLDICQTLEPGKLPFAWEELPVTDLDDIWEYWQCSADENRLGNFFGVESAAIDLSLSRFSEEELSARQIRPFIPNTQPPPQGGSMPPEPVVFYLVVDDGVNNYINIRDNHGVQYADRGNVPVGTVIPAFAQFEKPNSKGYGGKHELWILTMLSSGLSGWVAVEWNGKILCELVQSNANSNN